jgi:hypothetical protein
MMAHGACTMPSLSPKSNTDWPELLKDVIFGQQKKKKREEEREMDKRKWKTKSLTS